MQVADNNVDRRKYKWYEMAFSTTWASPNSHLIFCFDVPQSLHASLRHVVSSSTRPLDLASIYSLHVTIIDEIIMLFDTAVWSLRDIVREIESVHLFNNVLA